MPFVSVSFCINMTAIFHDIKSVFNTPKQKEPILGLHYAEILDADDTLVFGTHTHSINKLLHQTQQKSQKYKMKLNLDTCANLTLNQNQSSVKYMNGNEVPRKPQARNLGATMTDAVDNHKEVLNSWGS